MKSWENLCNKQGAMPSKDLSNTLSKTADIVMNVVYKSIQGYALRDETV